MTVSSTSTFELTRDQLIRRAYQLAGALDASQQPTGNDISLAADILGMELDFLQAEGIILRTVVLDTVALVDGTAEYTLDSDTVDVVVEPDGKAGMVWETAGSETMVRSISRADYQALGNKTVEGTPTLCWINRGATITATFWPVPSASMTFRFSKVRLLYDAAPGSTTMDFARKWQKPLVYSMAYQIALAKGAPLDRVGFLKNTAEELKKIALSDEHQRGHGQFAIYRWGY
jgi:hypothetical protein